jgi:uncharacterized spore protein YtfJ
MKVEELMRKARDSIDISQVFGEPYERDGVVLIPVARVSGGGGSGSGPSGTQQSGMGYGFKAEPAGAFVIKDGNAVWRPATNVNRIVAGAFVVAVVSVLRFPRMLKQARKLFR